MKIIIKKPIDFDIQENEKEVELISYSEALLYLNKLKDYFMG